MAQIDAGIERSTEVNKVEWSFDHNPQVSSCLPMSLCSINYGAHLHRIYVRMNRTPLMGVRKNEVQQCLVETLMTKAFILRRWDWRAPT